LWRTRQTTNNDRLSHGAASPHSNLVSEYPSSAGDLVAGFGWSAKVTGDKIAGATGSEIFARFEESEVL
jgi:hypothetical protein